MGSFYEVGPSNIEPGQIVIIPSLYPNKDRLILNINVQADPSEQNLEAIVSPFEQRTIHVPVKSLGLKSDEYAFIIKGKLRPAVVIAGGPTRWPMNPSEQIYICVPVYTVEKPRIKQKFVIEVQALKYPSMFYLPLSTQHNIEECVARFALIQVAHGTAVKPLMASGKPVMLSTDFWGLLKTQLINFCGGVLPENIQNDLRAYGEIVMEEAKAQGIS